LPPVSVPAKTCAWIEDDRVVISVLDEEDDDDVGAFWVRKR